MDSNDTPCAPTIDEGTARRLIADQFPQWADLPVRAIVPGGWDNRTFRLGETMSIRLPSATAYVPQVAKEHHVLPLLAPHLPLPIPVPLARGAPDAIFPWPWSVYRWIEGTPASAATLSDLPAFGRALAQFLRALHHLDASDGPAAGAHNFHRGGNLAVYDDQARAALAALAHRIDGAVAMRLWDQALASHWQAAPVWVHGDIAPGNLLTREGALSAVIDFGSSAVGDPACDLVIAWTLFSGPSRAAFQDALDLDAGTWQRARGWGLWKAAITAAGHDANQREAGAAWQMIETLLADARAQDDR